MGEPSVSQFPPDRLQFPAMPPGGPVLHGNNSSMLSRNHSMLSTNHSMRSISGRSKAGSVYSYAGSQASMTSSGGIRPRSPRRGSETGVGDDCFDNAARNTALSGGFDYIAGRSLKPRAPVFYAGTDVRVGYSAGLDPYNVNKNNLWLDKSMKTVIAPIEPRGTRHDRERVDWLRSEPTQVQMLVNERAKSPSKRHPFRCPSPEKRHAYVNNPKSARRKKALDMMPMRDLKSSIYKSSSYFQPRRANVFQGRITSDNATTR